VYRPWLKILAQGWARVSNSKVTLGLNVKRSSLDNAALAQRSNFATVHADTSGKNRAVCAPARRPSQSILPGVAECRGTTPNFKGASRGFVAAALRTASGWRRSRDGWRRDAEKPSRWSRDASIACAGSTPGSIPMSTTSRRGLRLGSCRPSRALSASCDSKFVWTTNGADVQIFREVRPCFRSAPHPDAEVGPRDGLQSFHRFVDTDTKVEMIDRLSELSGGHRGIELWRTEGRAALRDAEEVLGRIAAARCAYRALVPNARGRSPRRSLQDRRDARPSSIAGNQKTRNDDRGGKGGAQNLESFRIADATAHPFVMGSAGVLVRLRGSNPGERVLRGQHRLHDGGVRQRTWRARSAWKTPAHVNRCLFALRDRFPARAFGFHIHNCPA